MRKRKKSKKKKKRKKRKNRKKRKDIDLGKAMHDAADPLLFHQGDA